MRFWLKAKVLLSLDNAGVVPVCARCRGRWNTAYLIFFGKKIKILLTFRIDESMLGGTPQRGARTRAANAALNRARRFSKSETFRGVTIRCETNQRLNNLPRGTPERKKRGKEKVVTRIVAHAEMLS